MLLPVGSAFVFGCGVALIFLFSPILDLFALFVGPNFLHLRPLYQHREPKLPHRQHMRIKHLQHSEHNQQEKREQLLINPKLHFIDICGVEHSAISVHSVQISEDRG